jgi:hypothetical protein
MISYRNARYAGVLVALLGSVACGSAAENLRKNGSKDKGTDPAAVDPAAVDPAATGTDVATDPAVVKGDTLASLEVLSPADLARKIYDIFGPKMTVYNDGKMDMDFIEANANSFTGSISTDPTLQFAKSATTGYFLALVDCSVEADATKMVTAVASSATPAEIKDLAADLQAACKIKPGDAVKALVQSLSFCVKH